MGARTWRRCSSTSPATGGASHDRGITTADLGAAVSPPRAVSPILAAPAGACLLAGSPNVHLGVHSVIPDAADRQSRGTRRGDAARRRATLGSGAAQPDGRCVELSRGD